MTDSQLGSLARTCRRTTASIATKFVNLKSQKLAISGEPSPICAPNQKVGERLSSQPGQRRADEHWRPVFGPLTRTTIKPR